MKSINCERKFNETTKNGQGRVRIQSNVIDSWLRKNQSIKQSSSMGIENVHLMTCMSPFG